MYFQKVESVNRIRDFIVSDESFSRSVSWMCWKLAKVRALSNDIICDWMHVCLYSWLCAFWGCMMFVCPVGNECWYSWLCARLGICVYALMLNLWCAIIWLVRNIWIAVDVYVDEDSTRWGLMPPVYTDECAFIWFVLNIWFAYWGVCSWVYCTRWLLSQHRGDCWVST